MVQHLSRFLISVYHAPGQAVDDLAPLLEGYPHTLELRVGDGHHGMLLMFLCSHWSSPSTISFSLLPLPDFSLC
jgi:hypothetical protein